MKLALFHCESVFLSNVAFNHTMNGFKKEEKYMLSKRCTVFLAATAAVILLMMTFAACGGAGKTETIKGLVVEKPVHEPVQIQMPPMGEMMGMRGERGGAAGERGGAPGRAGGPGGPGGPPGFGSSKATPAVYIDNGRYWADKSKAGVVAAGKVGDALASGLKITAKEGDVGGVYVKGLGSEYTIANANIELSGNGGFGLGGPGSGASVDDYGTLIIRNSTITTNGESRNATAAQNHSILKVYNSTLTAHGVPFTPDTTNTEQKKQLEIDGNSRAHVTLSNSYSYFYYSTIIADGWAALSTDGSEGFVYLEANNCKVQTVKAGYGTYADMGCHNVINNCDFDVANMAGIIAGEADITFKDTKAKCGTYFALIHSIGAPAEVSTLKVTGGEIATKSPVVLVKSANAEIQFDGVKMASESGILIKSTISVDPQAANAADPKGEKVYGIQATFKDMDVTGDIIHTEDKANRIMTLYLVSTMLKGAVKDASISFNPLSQWMATADSNVTLVGSVDVSQIDAPSGVTINAVAGQSGTYKLASGGTLILKAS
ncbi:MAG: hypothetical protein H6Q04_78 [Acidobacteria bacterium]|nr:hypothetical protein [Acidobacteriota bacterium]